MTERETLLFLFRDIPDDLNRQKRTAGLQTRWFRKGDKADEDAAVKELEPIARKHGFTPSDITKVVRHTCPTS